MFRRKKLGYAIVSKTFSFIASKTSSSRTVHSSYKIFHGCCCLVRAIVFVLLPMFLFALPPTHLLSAICCCICNRMFLSRCRRADKSSSAAAGTGAPTPTELATGRTPPAPPKPAVAGTAALGTEVVGSVPLDNSEAELAVAALLVVSEVEVRSREAVSDIKLPRTCMS